MAQFIIIAVIVLFFLSKFLLFNVKVNSVVFMIFGIVAITLDPPLVPVSEFSFVLVSVNIIDCIRDLVVSYKFYRHSDSGIDGQFAVKSLLTVALALLGWFVWDKSLIYMFIPRAVFLCIVHPLMALSVWNDIQGKIEIGYPLPYVKWQYSPSKKICYFYQKLITKLYDDGKLVANTETVIEERNLSNKRLSDSYPKSKFSKIASFLQNKETKEKIKKIKDELNEDNTYRHTAYISSAYFEQYADKIERALKMQSSSFSPWKIKELSELSDLNLTTSNGYDGDVKWSEYFIIKSLKKLVRDGVITDFKCSDDPLDNHVYGVHMTSHNADSNPLLALDDD